MMLYICLTILRLFPGKELGKSWLRQKVRKKPARTLQEPLQEPCKPWEGDENTCRPQRRFQRISCSLSCGQFFLETLSLSVRIPAECQRNGQTLLTLSLIMRRQGTQRNSQLMALRKNFLSQLALGQLLFKALRAVRRAWLHR